MKSRQRHNLWVISKVMINVYLFYCNWEWILILQHGADPNKLSKSSYCSSFGDDLSGGSPTECTVFLQLHGDYLNNKTVWNRTPLYVATMDNHIKCTLLLLLYWADSNWISTKHDWLLFACTFQCNIQCVTLLLKYKADPIIASKSLMTPMLMSCYSDDVSCVTLLLGHGADPNYATTINNGMSHYCLC
jgi:ankyrin repeat protein